MCHSFASGANMPYRRIETESGMVVHYLAISTMSSCYILATLAVLFLDNFFASWSGHTHTH
jgi:hypothetical protein